MRNYKEVDDPSYIAYEPEHMKEKNIILVSHNINLIAELCDKVILMKNGEILDYGDTVSMLSMQNLQHLFNSKIKLIINPETQKPLMVY